MQADAFKYLVYLSDRIFLFQLLCGIGQTRVMSLDPLVKVVDPRCVELRERDRKPTLIIVMRALSACSFFICYLIYDESGISVCFEG